MTELGSAPVPPPGDDDHRRPPLGDARDHDGTPPGDARDHDGGPPVIIVYADFECPYCAAVHARLTPLPAELVFRHFPVRSSHPRAWPAATAAEAAGLQGRFWEMHDALFADQARLEDPHLWRRARDLGLDVDRFDADRRSDAAVTRVKRDFHSGVRAGVVTTPALFLWGPDGAERIEVAALEQALTGGR